jgi:alkylation response protein AidB-like acyl-CoA dehydrogenase
VPPGRLLGGEARPGLQAADATFEGARIQTAARAVGVARRALELGLRYASTASSSASRSSAFPRVADKLAMMAGETVLARELTYFAAREKDKGKALRHRGRHGQAAGRPRRLEQRRSQPADPRRQRLCAGIRDQPRAVRRPHPQHLRRRRRDPGAGDRIPPASTM